MLGGSILSFERIFAYSLLMYKFQFSLCQEAVAKVFQDALQSCDQKKVHFKLLDVYERTEQHELTDDLLNRMTRKFKHSCKVCKLTVCC